MRNILSPAIKFLVAVPMLAMLLSGCGDHNAEPMAPEETVRVRAQGWLDALLNGDLEGAYAYTSPSFRQFATAGRYHARVEGAASWDTAVVDKVVCDGPACEVRIIVEYEIKRMGVRNRRPLDYKWIEVEGEWWLFVPAR